MTGCGRKIGPYDCCTVVCGDCLELMKVLPDKSVDLVLTDPPYGLTWNSTGFRGDFKIDWKAAQKWDYRLGDDELRYIIAKGKEWIVWGGNYYASALGDCRAPLVWDKGTGNNSFADGELAFTSFQTGTLRIFRHQWCGAFKASERRARNYHPTQKPVALMEWCLSRLPHAKTVIDPFLGSGTTAVAAKKLGRHFLGFEIEPEYCRIAEERIALVEMQPKLFQPEAEQTALDLPAPRTKRRSEVRL